MDGFWTNFLANLLATLVSVAAGIPIALGIDRKVRSRGEKEKSEEQRQRTVKIIELLRDELAENLENISEIHYDASYTYQPIKVELWHAFSDGGELQWISDPGILDALADSYGELAHLSVLYRHYFEVFLVQRNEVNVGVPDPLFDHVLKARKRCEISIEGTLIAIRNKLRSLGETEEEGSRDTD
jgi:hypothetical protein